MNKFIAPFHINKLICGTTTTAAGPFYHSDLHSQIAAFLGINKNKIIIAEQVHGNGVMVVDGTDGGAEISRIDALVTGEKDLTLVIRTADCVPMFFLDQKKKLIGIAHAGWRGSLAGIGHKTVEQFVGLGSQADDIEVFLGPHIETKCYQVGTDVYKRFNNQFGANDFFREQDDRLYLDLAAVNVDILMRAGIVKSKIKVSDYCTFCHNQFYSYRRDSGKPGKFAEMISFISLCK